VSANDTSHFTGMQKVVKGTAEKMTYHQFSL